MLRFLITSFLILFLFAPIKSSAQKDTVVFYFDSSLTITKLGSAFYKEFAVKEDTGWFTCLINLKLKIKVMEGVYKDSTLETGNGLFQYFFPSGELQTTGYYINGKQQAVWKVFNESKRVIDSVYFKEGEIISEGTSDYYENGMLHIYDFTNTATDEKIKTEYDAEGHLHFHSHFLKKEGDAAYFYPNGNMMIQTFFNKYGMTSVVHYDENGKKMSDKDFQKQANQNMTDNNTPQYPGGDFAFFSYIEEKLKNNTLLKDQLSSVGEITFTFWLDEKGRPNKVEILNYTSGDLLSALSEIINSMPQWNMHGVKSYGPVRRTIKFY